MCNLSKVSAMLIGLATAMLVGSAQGTTFKVLYRFCSQKDCKDGRQPTGPIAHDQQGNFYAATTNIDGGDFQGTIDRIGPGGKHYKAKVLHTYNDFPTAEPNAGVIIDVSGNIYGTTRDVIYELVWNADHTKRKYQVIYTFCPEFNCSNGGEPSGPLGYAGADSGLPYDGVSPLYGTATVGGVGNGVVYQLVPNGDHWDESVVYSFCQQAKCADGAEPNGGVYVAADNSLYGVSRGGGKRAGACTLGCGIVFHLSPNAPFKRGVGEWKEETVYAFCQVGGCADGKEPYYPPVMDAQGNLVGAIERLANGKVFKLSRSGEHWTYTTLSNDINMPRSVVTLDSAGNIYGEMDAFPGQGAVYRLSGSTLTTLHTFCAKQTQTCKYGANPRGGLLLDADGKLFGITGLGGNNDSGTLFELTP